MRRTLRMGYQGDDVRAVQEVLNFQIRRLEPLKVDGKFGPLTKARVVEFQPFRHYSPANREIVGVRSSFAGNRLGAKRFG